MSPVREGQATFFNNIAAVICTHLLMTVGRAQTTEADGGGGDSGGIGMAEIIAIMVCTLIILTFALSCVIMLRNASKKKKMAEDAKKEAAKP